MRDAIPKLIGLMALLAPLFPEPEICVAQTLDSSRIYSSTRPDSAKYWYTRVDTVPVPLDTVKIPVPLPPPIAGTKLLSGTQKAFDSRTNPIPARTTVNAVSAQWGPWTVNNPVNWYGGVRGSWIGGTMRGNWNQLLTPWSAYHSTAALHVGVDSAIVSGIRVDNYGDGPRFMMQGAHYFTFRDSWLTHIHDDCTEDDRLKSGLIENNLFDGCHVGVSIRPAKADEDTVDGRGDTLVIRGNLIRLEPAALTSSAPNTHGGFLKVGNVHPERNLTVVMTGNIFRADMLPGVGTLCLNQHGKVIAKKTDNNIVVWLGPGAFPCLPLPDGWTLTTDKGVWDRGVIQWKAARPTMQTIP